MSASLYDDPVRTPEGGPVRPATIMSLVLAAIFFVGGVGFAIYAFFVHKDADQGVRWHFWLAPVLMIGVGAAIAQTAAMYWFQVGRKEVRGRRPGE